LIHEKDNHLKKSLPNFKEGKKIIFYLKMKDKTCSLLLFSNCQTADCKYGSLRDKGGLNCHSLHQYQGTVFSLFGRVGYFPSRPLFAELVPKCCANVHSPASMNGFLLEYLPNVFLIPPVPYTIARFAAPYCLPSQTYPFYSCNVHLVNPRFSL